MPTDKGGLGFGYKWKMDGMHDTLGYMVGDAAHRRRHHHKMTFGLTYAFDEAFVLPISHDEVVYAWIRRGGPQDPEVVVVPIFGSGQGAYRLGLPRAGRWREVLNTYGGGNADNMGTIIAQAHPAHGQAASADMRLPGLSTVFLMPDT